MTEHGGPVGVVGLGAMGGPVARNLAERGWSVTGYDREPAALAALAPAGVQAAGDLAAVARCPVVLLFVPGDADVLEVAEAVAAAPTPPARLVVCSSVTPQTCRRAAELVAPTVVVDAALTGGVRAAEAGRINLLVGGPDADVRELRPLFDGFCATVHHLGPLGSGQVGKTVNNLLHWAEIAAIVEALELGEALGVPAPRMRAALFDGPTDSRTLREIEHFRLTWWKKDLDNAFVMAKEAGHPLDVSRTVQQLMPEITVDRLGGLVGRPDL